MPWFLTWAWTLYPHLYTTGSLVSFRTLLKGLFARSPFPLTTIAASCSTVSVYSYVTWFLADFTILCLLLCLSSLWFTCSNRVGSLFPSLLNLQYLEIPDEETALERDEQNSVITYRTAHISSLSALSLFLITFVLIHGYDYYLKVCKSFLLGKDCDQFCVRCQN